ncbi:mechanosensitive ion channel family protein [Flammeovirga kamogawensis]|nr:mechanosensitive ion channel family protein [Flammeovirga kamogawensis]
MIKRKAFLCLLLCLISILSNSFAQQSTQEKREKEQLEVYNEIKSLIVADSIYRVYLREQIARLDSLSGVKKKSKQVFLPNGIPVAPFSDTLFYVHRRKSMSASLRAKSLEDSLRKIADNTLYLIDSVDIEPFEHTYKLVFKGETIHVVDTVDAKLAQTSKIELARERQYLINYSLHEKINYQGKYAGMIALIGLFLLLFFFKMIGKGYRLALIKVVRDNKGWFRNKRVKNVKVLTEENQINIARYLLLIIRFGLIFILISLYLPIVGRFSPPLRDISDEFFGYIFNPFIDILKSFIEYTPNLLKIGVIIFVFHYTIQLVKTFADAIADGRLKIQGFYPDWVPPTFKIIKFVLYTFMVIMIFPLLPGAESQEFKGISVFVGVLLSIGSTSVITNAISGIVITYMRRFKIGDWIRIGDIMGEVVERSLFVTRLKTSKNEIVTIPNSKISESNTINYSQPINRFKLIIHTTVTIGYDVPWRKVHAMLKEAAEITDGLIAGEIPFVLQTSLDDYYVSYQLNAHTRQPEKLARIYSRLHQNIQDVFAREGVEIMSPHYRSNREDNEITIPDFKLMQDAPKEEKPPMDNSKTENKPDH